MKNFTLPLCCALLCLFLTSELRGDVIPARISSVKIIAPDKTSVDAIYGKTTEGREALVDGNLATKMCVTNANINEKSNTCSIVYTPTAYTTSGWVRDMYLLNGYAVGSGNDAHLRDPVTWKIYGSRDGVLWNEIDSVSENGEFPAYNTLYAFTPSVLPTAGYAMFRMDVTKTSGQNNAFQISELQFSADSMVRYMDASPEATVKAFLNGTVHSSFGANESTNRLSDHNTGTKMCATNLNINANSSTFSLVYEFEVPRLVEMYSFTTANDSENRDPKTWNLYGSNTGNADDWVLIDAVADASSLISTSRYTTTDFAVDVPDFYKYLKFDFTQTRGTDACLQLSELSLYVRNVPEPSAWVLLLFGSMGLWAVYYRKNTLKALLQGN